MKKRGNKEIMNRPIWVSRFLVQIHLLHKTHTAKRTWQHKIKNYGGKGEWKEVLRSELCEKWHKNILCLLLSLLLCGLHLSAKGETHSKWSCCPPMNAYWPHKGSHFVLSLGCHYRLAPGRPEAIPTVSPLLLAVHREDGEDTECERGCNDAR